MASIVLVLTGCSTSEESSPAEGAVAPQSTDSTEAMPAEVSYVETETCRTEMRPMVDAMLANSTKDLSFGDFEARYLVLDEGVDAAALTCSNELSLPLSEVMYEYANAYLWWDECTAGDCAERRIQRHLRAGNDAAREVEAALTATEG